MEQKISVSYNWGNLPIAVGEGTESNHVMNKGQVDALASTTESNANDYTDSKDTAMKSYVDGKILGLGEYVGAIDPINGLPINGSGELGAIDKNDYWTFNADGNILGEEVHKYEKLIANVSGASVDNEFRIEHAPHTDDTRHEFNNVTIPATIQEVLGQSTVEVQTLFENGDVFVLGGVTMTAGGNLDIVTNTTLASQATAIKNILEADNAFNTQYAISDNLGGVLTITERVDKATGINLSHDESGIVGGNVVFASLITSVAYDLGDYIVNHNLGYKYVQVITAETATDLKLETPPIFVDENNLKLVNASDADIIVNGVVSI